MNNDHPSSLRYVQLHNLTAAFQLTACLCPLNGMFSPQFRKLLTSVQTKIDIALAYYTMQTGQFAVY
jgi:hypothetical protein